MYFPGSFGSFNVVSNDFKLSDESQDILDAACIALYGVKNEEGTE